MIPRYSPPAMAALFTDEARFAMWLQVELLATEGWVEVDGVLVAEGRRQRKWLRQLNRSDQEQPLVESVTRTLEAQLVRQVDRPRVTATPQVRRHDSEAPVR